MPAVPHKVCRKIFLLLLVTGIMSRGYAQGNYADFPNERKEIFFREGFDEGRNPWPLPQAKIEDGMLVVSDRWNRIVPKTAVSIPLEPSRDFELEVMAAPASAVVSGQIHLNNYAWAIAGESGSAVYQSGTQLKYLGENIPKNTSHKFTIRRLGYTLYYFLDEKAMGSTAFSPSGFENKLLVGFSGRITVDAFSVSYLLRPGQLPLVKTEDLSQRDDIPSVSPKNS